MNIAGKLVGAFEKVLIGITNFVNWALCLAVQPVIWLDEKVTGKKYARAIIGVGKKDDHIPFVKTEYEKKEDIGATGTLHIVRESVSDEQKREEHKALVEQIYRHIEFGKEPPNEPIYKGGVVSKEVLESIQDEFPCGYVVDEARDDLCYNAKTNSVERINPNDEPKQDLLVICLEDINAVPNVYYKGKPVDKKVRVDFSWNTRDAHIFYNPTYINIEHREGKLFNTATIRHNEMTEDHDLQEKYDELKEKYDKLLEGMAGYMLGDTDWVIEEGDDE
ncbi:hypothetical protein [Priestia megaterium]|uniref:hypothetical protein n=1 Tax=Priestia megaterium TaxID=1404 RepID=UPI003CC6C554